MLESVSEKTNNKLSINTVRDIIQVFKNGVSLALKLQLINKNPTENVKLPKQLEKEVTAFTLEEQKLIESYCLKSKKVSYLGVILCLYTGIRLGELLSLTWSDIDFKNKVMHIRKTSYFIKIEGKYKVIIDKPKTAKSNRIIPLSDKLIGILLYIRSTTNSSYVISNRLGEIIDNRSYQRTFQSILKKCKIKHYSFHSLRHTFATRAIEIGVDVKTLSEILGHTNVNITLKRYAHSLFDYNVQEMNRISELL